jgi:mannose-6-phosphate isomerase
MTKPKKIRKPWGWEMWFAHTTHYVGKIIFIRKGHRLSKQYHRFKHETVHAYKGTWLLELESGKKLMRPGMSVVIKPGVVHRFCAPRENAWLVEASTPQIKDVVRLEDDYGRSRR